MRVVSLFLLLISINGFSQWKSYTISPRGDTLNRVDNTGKKQGPWSIHVDELRGERGYEEEGEFENDQKTGTWKKYSLEGVKIAEENYSWGKLNGRQKYFTYNGGLLREETWRALDPKIAFDTVAVYDVNDPTLEVRRIVVKNEGVSMKHGKWTYYDPREGTVEATENYVMNKLRTDEDEFLSEEDQGLTVVKPKSDSLAKKVKPQVVLDYEKKNSGKKKIKSRDGATGL